MRLNKNHPSEPDKAVDAGHIHRNAKQPLTTSRLRHTLAIIVLLYGGAWGVAAATTYVMLGDTSWTGAKPEPTQATTTASPATGTQPAAAMGDQSGLIGTCAIPTTTSIIRSTCDAPGALTIVGTIRLDATQRSCKAIPFTETVRKYKGHYLCLGGNQ